MFQKILYFIKYNNLTVLLVLAIFLLGSGVFAATPTGQEVIGQQEQKIEGLDNTLLLTADLDNFNMDFKIEKIEEDAKYYYVTYTYLDLVKDNSAWQYLLQEKVKKISKKLREDLGVYLTEQFKQEYEARIKDLREAKASAEEIGAKTRIEVTEYTGLIGQVLNLAGEAIPGYDPVKKYEVPSPTVPPTILQFSIEGVDASVSPTDSMVNVYDNYIKENDPDDDNIFGSLDNCPNFPNSDQLDGDNDGIGDLCDTDKGAGENNSETATTTEIISEDVAGTTGDNAAVDNVDATEVQNTTETSSDSATVAEPTDVQIIELPVE